MDHKPIGHGHTDVGATVATAATVSVVARASVQQLVHVSHLKNDATAIATNLTKGRAQEQALLVESAHTQKSLFQIVPADQHPEIAYIDAEIPRLRHENAELEPFVNGHVKTLDPQVAERAVFRASVKGNASATAWLETHGGKVTAEQLMKRPELKPILQFEIEHNRQTMGSLQQTKAGLIEHLAEPRFTTALPWKGPLKLQVDGRAAPMLVDNLPNPEWTALQKEMATVAKSNAALGKQLTTANERLAAARNTPRSGGTTLVAGLSLIGSVAETYTAYTHFKQGQMGSAVAHSLAASGQLMIAIPALTRTASHLGSFGMVMATGGMIAGMAIDNK